MADQAGLGRLSIGTIRCVQEVLAYKSISLAAGRLGITQSAVSQQVSRFEKLSGIPVTNRKGGSLSVRTDEVADLVAAMVAAADEISRVGRGETRLRLGICDYLTARYCASIDSYREIASEFDVYIDRPAGLSGMFGRGELDVVIRPLYHHEAEIDLMTKVPLVWVAADGADRAKPGAPVPVILETHLSPYAYYAVRALKDARTSHRVVAHVDDLLVRSHFVAFGLGSTAIPEFLLSSVMDKAMPTALPRPGSIRFGLFLNQKVISYKAAEKLFDALKIQLEK